MSELTTATPVYCTGSSNDAATMAALMNGCMGGGTWNNPFIYLVWLMFAQRFGWGNNNDNASMTQSAELMSKLNSISATLTNNQNTNLMMDAINGNHEALHTISATIGVDFATLSGAVAQVQNAISTVGGQVGMSGQQVINSVLLGNKDLTQALQTCCCENKTLALQNTNAIQGQLAGMASQNQLQQSQIAASTQASIENIRQALTQGFSQVGYQGATNVNSIIQAGNANTQRIIDTMNNHWSNELSQELQNAKFETSQLKQNVYLGNLINGNTTTNGNIW